jgi:hypothetical protein
LGPVRSDALRRPDFAAPDADLVDAVAVDRDDVVAPPAFFRA